MFLVTIAGAKFVVWSLIQQPFDQNICTLVKQLVKPIWNKFFIFKTNFLANEIWILRFYYLYFVQSVFSMADKLKENLTATLSETDAKGKIPLSVRFWCGLQIIEFFRFHFVTFF